MSWPFQPITLLTKLTCHRPSFRSDTPRASLPRGLCTCYALYGETLSHHQQKRQRDRERTGIIPLFADSITCSRSPLVSHLLSKTLPLKQVFHLLPWHDMFCCSHYPQVVNPTGELRIGYHVLPKNPCVSPDCPHLTSLTHLHLSSGHNGTSQDGSPGRLHTAGAP